MNGRANLGAAQSRELLEQANDAQIAEMGDKVLQLKELTQSIGRQAKESNSILQNMMPEFDKAGNLLKGTVSHLKAMMQQGSGKHMCYMIVFVLFLFFLMYFLRGLGSRFGGSKPVELKDTTKVPILGTG